MTTELTPLQERIARALDPYAWEKRDEWSSAGHPNYPLLDNLVAVSMQQAAAVLPIIRAAQADALRDAAESTRPGVDMNPTTIDGNWDYMWWTRYLAGLDGMWRSRLREAADRIEQED